jgi:hypothetical protein
MPHAVMANIDRAYRALGLVDDPDCELLLVDGDHIRPFDVDLPQLDSVVERNRVDLLMTGHRTAADARPTFCNACNLSMVNAFGLAAGYGRGVDTIITGDSTREQRDYYLWITRLARRLGLRPPRQEAAGFKGFLQSLDGIARLYFTDIHGAADEAAIATRGVATDVHAGLGFFSIYEDTSYASGKHWAVLTDLLGFTFDDIAFSFTESDCGNPALMAHLRALKCERRYGRSYAEGLAEYVDFALSLMRQKEFPETLIEAMRARYSRPDAVPRMRAAMDAYAGDAYRLTEEQLVAMVYAPYTEKGAGLDRYLAAEQPDLVDAAPAIRRLLGDDADFPDLDTTELAERLERSTGLSIAQLRVLYAGSLRLPSPRPDTDQIIDLILEGDPHKAMILTRHEPGGALVPELLSGR